jgi:hypothetical protein
MLHVAPSVINVRFAGYAHCYADMGEGLPGDQGDDFSAESGR